MDGVNGPSPIHTSATLANPGQYSSDRNLIEINTSRPSSDEDGAQILGHETSHKRFSDSREMNSGSDRMENEREAYMTGNSVDAGLGRSATNVDVDAAALRSFTEACKSASSGEKSCN